MSKGWYPGKFIEKFRRERLEKQVEQVNKSDLIKYLKENIERLAPKLVEIKEVEQFLLWDKIYGKKG